MYKRTFVKSSTHAMYIFMIEQHLIPFFNERATIMEIDVQEFVDRQLEAGHSVKTVKGMVTMLRMIAVYASKQKGCLPPVGWQLHYNAGAPCRRTTENVLNVKELKQDINVKHGVVDVYKTLSTILGHSSVSVTMNFYVHPDNNQKKKCIENMLGHVLPKT